VPDAPTRQTTADPPGRGLSSRLRRSHGVRSGAVLGAATIVFSITGYLFQTACIRFLGPSRYSDIAALLALSAVIAIPLGSVQTLIAREAAYLSMQEDNGELRRFFRRTMRITVPAALAVLVIALALTGPIEDLLNIASAAVVVAGLSALGFLIVGAILYGFLQGLQRFPQLAANYVISGMAKPVLVVPVLFAGLGAAGALSVNTLAAGGAVALAIFALRDVWRAAPATQMRAPTRFARREVAVLVIGSLAFASLTNLDIVLASYYLDGDSAGIYAAAALVGKLVLLAPAAVVTVLLPKAASRAAAGANSQRILMLSAGVTLALTLAATLVLALIPEGVLVWAFGPDFRASTELLGWFGLAMTAAALINVYLSVYLAHRSLGFPLLVGAAAVAQVVLVAIWHSEPREIVLATLACCAAVVVIHEVAFPHRLIRILRTPSRPAVADDGGSA